MQPQTALGVNSGYATVYYASITIPTAGDSDIKITVLYRILPI
jgi:hypothetical protein